MKLKIIKKLFKVYYSFFTNKAKINPKRAGWYITDLCNAKCLKCDIWKNKSKDSKDLSLEKNKKIIDNLADFGINQLEIVGGEPFSYHSIFEIIKYTRKKGINIEFNTNGLALNEKKIDQLIRLGVKRIGFSVDGINPLTHDKMIGIKGAYDKLLKNIKYYLSKGGTGHMSTLISALNAEELVDLFYLSQKLGLDGIVYQPFQYVPSFLDDKNKQELDYTDCLGKIDKVIDELIKLKKKKEFTIYNSISYLKKIKSFIRNKKMPNFCFAPYYHITIDNQGNLVPCTPYRKKIGNLIEKPLTELWNSKEFIKTRKELKRAKICHSCWLTGDAEETISFHLIEIIRRINFKNLFKIL